MPAQDGRDSLQIPASCEWWTGELLAYQIYQFLLPSFIVVFLFYNWNLFFKRKSDISAVESRNQVKQWHPEHRSECVVVLARRLTILRKILPTRVQRVETMKLLREVHLRRNGSSAINVDNGGASLGSRTSKVCQNAGFANSTLI